MEEMTESELIAVLIDKYTDLQRIKKQMERLVILNWNTRSKSQERSYLY